MSNYDKVRAALADLFSVTEDDDGARVTTQCLYPSNGFVQVLVRGGEDTFFVSDEGGALREIEATGNDIRNPDKLLTHLIVSQGLTIKNGVIRSPQCTASEVGVAIAFVANASASVADWLFDHTKMHKQRNFKVLVATFLRERYVHHVRPERITGRSNKPHTFDNIIFLGEGRKLIVDPVIHDPASINARLVANLDVRHAEYPDLEQRIVYDDTENWAAEELNLLQVGAPIVPFSKAREALNRFKTALN